MVIGNGLVAKRFGLFNNKGGFLLFASGVSNSKNNDNESYNREFNLFKESVLKYNDKVIIYFSTWSIYDPQEKESPYVRHKLNIEDFIKTHIKKYHIFRVSNLAGISSNPNTILNYFFNHTKNDVNFDLWTNACRNIIDIDDAYLIIEHILNKNLFPNQVINIANPVNYPVKNIITAIEKFLNKKSNYMEIEKGTNFSIDTSTIQPIIQKLGIEFDDKYLMKLIHKYYSII